MTIFERPIVLLPLAFCLLVLGGATAFEEAQPYLGSGVDEVSRLAAMPLEPAAPGLSVPAHLATLGDCAHVLARLNSLALHYQPAAVRATMAPRCLALADDIAASTPTLSFAWYVGGQAEAALGQWEGFNRRIQLSQRTGRSEQWVAEQRAALVETHYAYADAATLAGHQADLEMLVLSNRGIQSMARRYISDPAFRERITAIVETMSQTDQRRFVSVVRRGWQ